MREGHVVPACSAREQLAWRALFEQTRKPRGRRMAGGIERAVLYPDPFPVRLINAEPAFSIVHFQEKTLESWARSCWKQNTGIMYHYGTE